MPKARFGEVIVWQDDWGWRYGHDMDKAITGCTPRALEREFEHRYFRRVRCPLCRHNLTKTVALQARNTLQSRILSDLASD